MASKHIFYIYKNHILSELHILDLLLYSKQWTIIDLLHWIVVPQPRGITAQPKQGSHNGSMSSLSLSFVDGQTLES